MGQLRTVALKDRDSISWFVKASKRIISENAMMYAAIIKYATNHHSLY